MTDFLSWRDSCDVIEDFLLLLRAEAVSAAGAADASKIGTPNWSSPSASIGSSGSLLPREGYGPSPRPVSMSLGKLESCEREPVYGDPGIERVERGKLLPLRIDMESSECVSFGPVAEPCKCTRLSALRTQDCKEASIAHRETPSIESRSESRRGAHSLSRPDLRKRSQSTSKPMPIRRRSATCTSIVQTNLTRVGQRRIRSTRPSLGAATGTRRRQWRSHELRADGHVTDAHRKMMVRKRLGSKFRSEQV